MSSDKRERRRLLDILRRRPSQVDSADSTLVDETKAGQSQDSTVELSGADSSMAAESRSESIEGKSEKKSGRSSIREIFRGIRLGGIREFFATVNPFKRRESNVGRVSQADINIDPSRPSSTRRKSSRTSVDTYVIPGSRDASSVQSTSPSTRPAAPHNKPRTLSLSELESFRVFTEQTAAAVVEPKEVEVSEVEIKEKTTLEKARERIQERRAAGEKIDRPAKLSPQRAKEREESSQKREAVQERLAAIRQERMAKAAEMRAEKPALQKARERIAASGKTRPEPLREKLDKGIDQVRLASEEGEKRLAAKKQEKMVRVAETKSEAEVKTSAAKDVEQKPVEKPAAKVGVQYKDSPPNRPIPNLPENVRKPTENTALKAETQKKASTLSRIQQLKQKETLSPGLTSQRVEVMRRSSTTIKNAEDQGQTETNNTRNNRGSGRS